MGVLLGGVLAFTPSEGMELLITDQSGQQLLGHGVIEGGTLVLRLSTTSADVKIVVVRQDGSFEVYSGRIDSRGLRMHDVAGAPEAELSALARDAGLTMSVERVDAVEQESGARDTPPAQNSQNGRADQEERGNGQGNGNESGGNEGRGNDERGNGGEGNDGEPVPSENARSNGRPDSSPGQDRSQNETERDTPRSDDDRGNRGRGN
jgi:hypothetical protein